MQAKVRKVNDGEGQVILSRKGLVAEQGSKKLEEAFENQTVITATVSQVMNGDRKSTRLNSSHSTSSRMPSSA